MIKLIANGVLVAAVVMAAAIVSTPSFAAKKKAVKAASCTQPSYCRSCANGVCNTNWCGADGKWYPSPVFSFEPFGISPKCQ